MVVKYNMKSVYLQCLVLLVTLYSYRVTAITCVSCVYDESVSYNQNHSCLANPTAMPTQECDNDYCVTAAGYYGVDNKLRVYRGCNDSDLYDWTNDCKFFKFNTVIDGYVCICDHRNSCNSDDTAYRKCHQCDSRQDSGCYNDQNGNPAYPCLTGHNNCIMETMEPYPHHGNTYTGVDLYDYVRRYCSNEDFGEEGVYTDYHHASLHCQHSCSTDGCNDWYNVCIADKTIQCTECYYDGGITSDSDKDCLTNPGTMPTTECYSQCFTKAWYTERGPLQVVRGCDREIIYSWTNECQITDGKYRICTCDSDDSCNADDSDYTRCYQCDTRTDDNCLDNSVGNLDVLPCLAGGRACITMTMTSYEPEEPLIGDSGNFDYIRRYCSDEYQSTGFFCSDYLSVAEQCIHVCFDDGCTYRKNDCASRDNITEPISCISCEYNSEAPDSDKECLTDPYSRGTITCNSKCVTFGHSQTGKQWVYRGCDCNDQYTWTGSCKRVKIGQSDFANICTCDSENFCNADDTGNHLCYQCDSRKDRDCYTDLQRNVPSPCLAGHSGCVTEMMEPYEEFTTSHGSSSFDYVTRYCGEENYGDDGNCIDFLGTSLLCYFSCKTDGCNDDSGCRQTSALNDQHYIVIVVLLWLSSAVG